MPTIRSFPGIAFQVETPMVVDLPRMDVAAFVGFAERGPVNVPVVVESYTDFADLFGGFYQLAWDEQTATWQTACLTPAVKAFFTQGGRRCWVVRVADQEQAIANQFPLAGLLQTNGDAYSPVVATARSVGSWSDGLQVRAGLLLERISIAPIAISLGTAFSLSLSLPRNQELQPGDLLQLDFYDQQHQHRAYVAIEAANLQVEQEITHIHADSTNTYWFCTVERSVAGFVEAGGSSVSIPILAHLTLQGDSWTLTQKLTSWIKFWFYLLSRSFSIDALIVMLAISFQVYQPGDWLVLKVKDGSRIWLLTKDAGTYRLNLQDVWKEGVSTTAPQAVTRIQKIQIALHVTSEFDRDYTLQNLACADPHPRFVGNLPVDEKLLAPQFGLPQPQRSPSQAALWKEAKSPRFPIALELPENTTIIPLGLSSQIPSRGAFPSKLVPLVRDGLVPDTDDTVGLSGANWSAFLPKLFLDSSLRLTGQRSLMAEAGDLLYLQGKALTGIHALFPIEEISMVALPDAAHRGWRLTPSVEPAPAKPQTSEVPPDPCTKASPFVPSILTAPPPPKPSPPPPSGIAGIQWQLLLPVEYEPTGLLEIQQAAARLTSARGDMVAVLGLPKHYRVPEALEHQHRLLTGIRRDGDTLDSYLTLYHPWLISRTETGDLIHTHPAGSMMGVMAARSLLRGAWVAPANEVVQETLATLPELGLADLQALYGAGINPIRRTAPGFVAWGSFTQSGDPDLENLNVRRLLILLKRLALREGQTYVFAPHSAAFRRRVQQQFEQVLSRLFLRGAFAGRVPAEGYQVVVDDPLNSQTTIAQGQFIVELRVAPSQPISFITVRLLQSDSNLLTVQEVRPNGG